MIQVIIFSIACIIAILNLIREIFVYRDIKSNFYCEHCHCFNEEISTITKCRQCHRSIEIKSKNWEHLLLHRVSWTPSKHENVVLKWSDYKKVPSYEIALSIFMIITLLIAIALNAYKIWIV